LSNEIGRQLHFSLSGRADRMIFRRAMGELLPFPSRSRNPCIKAVMPKIEAAEEKFDSITKTLETALDLLDQMTAKVAQMDGLLPTESLNAHFEKRRLGITDQVNRVHSLVALLSDLSPDHLKSKK
jgi:hypothetical protein